MTYHHGALRDSVLQAAATVIERDGVAALSLRSVAADLGVSHTAFRHHFGSREGVLNALATAGHLSLADELRETSAATGSFLEVGVAYVRWALVHRGEFAVMFQPDLLDTTEPGLRAARAETFAVLGAGVAGLSAAGAQEDAAAAVIAGWSIVHGIATLAITGNLDAAAVGPLVAGGDVEQITRRAAGMLFGSPRPSGSESLQR